MQISGSPYNCKNNYYLLKKTSSFANPATNFQGNPLNKLSGLFTLPNNKLKTYSIKDYNNLTTFDKKILRFEYKLNTLYNRKFYKNTEAIHDGLTNFMKSTLDSKYGEGNYVVITIGRSLSSIGKVLGYKIGEENVINIPLSNATRFSTPNSIKDMKQTEIEGLKQYLDTVGLTDEKIKNSDKTFILTDYCFSGQSLKATKNLFKSDKFFGQNSNIYIEDIDNMIPAIDNIYNFKDSVKHCLYESKFKPYSFVKKNTDLSKTKDAINTPKEVKKGTRLMWFKLLDNFMSGVKPSSNDLNEIKISPQYLD